MTKTKLIMVAGTIILTATTLFSTTPRKRFKSAPTQIWVGSPYGVVLFFISTTGHLTLTPTGRKALFMAEGVGPITMKTSSTAFARTVYFKP